MTDPKTRALEHLRLAEAYLGDRHETLDWHVHLAEELRALRTAIQAIGGSEWRGMDSLPTAELKGIRDALEKTERACVRHAERNCYECRLNRAPHFMRRPT